MKITIVTLSAVALIVTAPAVLAQNVSNKPPDQHHQTSKKHSQVVSIYAPRHAMHAKSLPAGYPGAFRYAPYEPKDYSLESSRQAGGGGGGGGSGM